MISVLFTWHAAVLAANQNYAARLATEPDLRVTLLIPPRWDESTSMVEAHVPDGACYRTVVDEVKRPCKGLSFRFRNIRRILTEVKPDVIFVYEEPYSYVALQLLYWKQRICPGAKFIFYTWQNLDCNYSFLRKRIEKYVFERSDLAVAGSQDVTEVLRLHGFQKKIRPIPLALDPADFPPFDAYALKAALNLTTFTIGYVGRLAKEKGLEDLLQAAALLGARPFRLRLSGSGSDAAELLALAKELNIDKNIVHLPYVQNTEMYQYYPAMDVLALPSRTTPEWKEQFGRVLIEAMICGVPVVGSSSGEIPLVIKSAGLVFEERNVAQLSEKFIQLMDNPGLRRELAEAGKKRVLESFTWEAVARQTAAVIREAAGTMQA